MIIRRVFKDINSYICAILKPIHPTNSPKRAKHHLLLSLLSSFAPNSKHSSSANPILIHPLPHTASLSQLHTPSTIALRLTLCLPLLWNKHSRQHCDKYLTYPTNSPKPYLLLSLHSSFTPNWRHCPSTNPFLLLPVLHTSLPSNITHHPP